MEPVSQFKTLLTVAYLGFHLLTGGPPMLAGQTALLAAASASRTAAPVAVAEQPAPVPQAAPVAPVPAPAPPPAGSAKPLKGIDAWGALVGNTISGKSDEDDLFEYYTRNGTAKQMVGDEKASGKWALKGQTVCFDYNNGDGETCYTVTVNGTKATFTDDDDNETVYDILPGNPKKL